MRSVLAAAIYAAILCFAVPPARAETVDVALIFAADVSRSVDDDEFKLQRQGYAAAVTNAQVLRAIAAGPHGAVALCFVEWSGPEEQQVVADWTVVRDGESAAELCRDPAQRAALLRRPHLDQRRARFQPRLFRQGRRRRRAAHRRCLRRRHQQFRPSGARRARRGARAPASPSTGSPSSTSIPIPATSPTPSRPKGCRNITGERRRRPRQLPAGGAGFQFLRRGDHQQAGERDRAGTPAAPRGAAERPGRKVVRYPGRLATRSISISAS